MGSQEKDHEAAKWPVSVLMAALITIPLTRWLAPGLIPMGAAQIWDAHGTGLGDWLWVGLPMFAWGVGINIVWLYPQRKHLHRHDPAKELIRSVLVSVLAGVLEEISFRWLLFFAAFPSLAISNYLFFGVFGFGIAEFVHIHLAGPLADFTTCGYLHDELFGRGWLLGASLLSANAFFRNGHRYQGLFGYANSWFVGMFLFYVMFHYGLGAAIVVHFMYDLLIGLTGVTAILLAD